MLGHLKSSTFMFHRVVLQKNGVELCHQFNGDVIYSLAMKFNVLGQCTIVIVIKVTIVFLFVVVFALISAHTDSLSDSVLCLTSKGTMPLQKDPWPYSD